MDLGKIGGFGLLNLLAAGLLAAAPAAAQLIAVDDGCGVLREAILAQASPDSAAADKPSVLRASQDEPVAPDPPPYCMDTAATTSAAFAAAMHAAGIPASWGRTTPCSFSTTPSSWQGRFRTPHCFDSRKAVTS